jgi:hypothetical protein
MDTGTAVLFKTKTHKQTFSGTIQKVVDYKSKWGDQLYHVLLDNGSIRIAFPDEVIEFDGALREALSSELGDAVLKRTLAQSWYSGDSKGHA